MNRSAGIAGAPRIPAGAVLRPRLLDRLGTDAALHVVHGPAGAGKTVLLAQWSGSVVVDGIWVTVDRAGTGASALVRAILRAATAAGLSAAGSLSSVEAALDGRGEAWELLADLAGAWRDIRLVIDDADLLDDATLAALVTFLRRTPSVRILAAVRRSSPLTEPGTALALDTTVIGASDLAFTPDEIAGLAERAGTDSDPERIAHFTGGLALAVRAMIVNDRAGTGPDAAVEAALAAIESYYSLSGAAAGLNGAAAGEPTPLRAFLLATSVAEVLTVDLATDLSGDTAAGALLDRVEADGFGMWTGHGDSRVFTYTTLVRELLRRELRRSRPTDVSALLRRAARWSLEHDRPFAALSMAMEIGDLTLASDVVRHAWLPLLASHAAQTRDLFAGTSLLTLRKYPLIAMMLALNFNASGLHRARAVQLFGLAILSARAQRSGSSAPDRALLRTMESASLRVTGRFKGAEDAALDAFDILHHLTPADHDELGRLEPTMWAHIGTTFLYTGRTDDAIDCFRQGIAVGDALKRPSALTSLALLAGALAFDGDIAGAEAVCREAREREWPPRWRDGYAGSLYQLAEALIALEHGDPETAERHVRSLDRHRDTIEHWPLIDQVEALIGLLRGEPAAALARLDASIDSRRTRSATSQPMLQTLASTRALLQLARGDSDAAGRTLAGSARRGGHALIGQARIALTRNDHAGALRLILQARADTLSVRQRAEADVVQWAALLRAGRQSDARDVASTTLAILTGSGLATPLRFVPEADLSALRRFATELEPGTSLAVLARPGLHSVVPDQSPLPALSEREQVVLSELVRSGSIVDIAATLSVSPNTVKSQLRSIYRKLGVTNRDDAVAVATTRDLGLR